LIFLLPITFCGSTVLQEEAMRGLFWAKNQDRRRGSRKKLLQVAVVVLGVLLALTGRAAEERAIKLRVAPVYPELAKRMKITGTVKIQATVDADGKVTDVKTMNGSRVLANAAEDAVRKWKFATGDGEAKVDVEVSFVLGE
jgi:TonB family protein